MRGRKKIMNNKYRKMIASLKLKGANYFLLFIDGKFIPQLSTPQTDLPVFLRNPVTKKNFSFKFPKNKILTQPVHCLFITTKSAAAKLCNLINVGENGTITIIEEHLDNATKKCSCKVDTEIIAAKNSKINYTKLFQNSKTRALTSYISSTKVTQRQESNAAINYGIKNISTIDENLQVTLHEKAISKILGWCAVGKNQSITVATTIEHHAAQAVSEELFKYILHHNGKGSFSGKILVPAKVKQSIAKLYNKNLLLNPAAQMHTAPVLEIYADDVAVHHGAATGQLDEAALFYLQTRGLKLKDAREILIHAFIAEVTAQFPAALQDKINR